MADPTAPAQEVRHKLQVHFDAHECRPGQDELDGMADDLDSLARQVGNFPVGEIRVLIERNARSNEYAVKLTLILPGETLVTSDHDRAIHPAFERALSSLENSVKGYKDRLNQIEERRKHENGTHQDLTPATGVDANALDDAARTGDYAAYRAAVMPYEDPLRLRVGRWVERYPAVQARMGRGLEAIDLVEAVLLTAFEDHEARPPGIRYGEWLDGLIDPTVRAFEHHPDRELDNVNMARSACDAAAKPA